MSGVSNIDWQGKAAAIRPDTRDVPFALRWHSLIRALLVESSVKLVARTAVDHADPVDGTKCSPSIEQLARETAYSERTIQTAWAILRGLGLAERTAEAGHDLRGNYRTPAEYRLIIPADWESLPLLGPHSAKFLCSHCHRRFQPQANCTLEPDGRVTFEMRRFLFCPEPKRSGKGSCFDKWSREHQKTGSSPLDDWSLFVLARSDQWSYSKDRGLSIDPLPPVPSQTKPRVITPTPVPALVPRPTPKPSIATALYRYWDAEERLLYVGITGDLSTREDSHVRRSSWMEFVARSTVARYPSRAEADEAERAAIEAERPLFNVKDNNARDATSRLVAYLVEHGRTDLLAPAVSRG